jgi:hypothetical protein
MADQIVVFVNEKPVTIYRGMQVKHALISYDQSLYEACTRGDTRVEDEHGFRVGLEGALHDGARIYTKEAGSGVRGPGSRKKNHE